MSEQETVTRVVKYHVDVSALRPEQAELILRHAGCARQAWNWATARWLDWQQNLRFLVAEQARCEAFAGLPVEPSTGQIGDALMRPGR